MTDTLSKRQTSCNINKLCAHANCNRGGMYQMRVQKCERASCLLSPSLSLFTFHPLALSHCDERERRKNVYIHIMYILQNSTTDLWISLNLNENYVFMTHLNEYKKKIVASTKKVRERTSKATETERGWGQRIHGNRVREESLDKCECDCKVLWEKKNVDKSQIGSWASFRDTRTHTRTQPWTIRPRSVFTHRHTCTHFYVAPMAVIFVIAVQYRTFSSYNAVAFTTSMAPLSIIRLRATWTTSSGWWRACDRE